MVGFGAAWYGALSLFPKLAELALGNKELISMLEYYMDPSSLFKTAALAATPVMSAVSNVGHRLLTFKPGATGIEPAPGD